MPIAGLTDSDLMRNFRSVTDPYSGQKWVAIPAIRPDWTIVHVQEADEQGNARIRGSTYDDLLKAKAADHLLVTCERIVPIAEVAAHPERTDIPGFLVTAVVHAPRGAWPHACDGEYSADGDFLSAYLAAAGGTDEAYRAFLAQRVVGA